MRACISTVSGRKLARSRRAADRLNGLLVLIAWRVWRWPLSPQELPAWIVWSVGASPRLQRSAGGASSAAKLDLLPANRRQQNANHGACPARAACMIEATFWSIVVQVGNVADWSG